MFKAKSNTNDLASYLDRLRAGLETREEQGLLRTLEPAHGVDFASNDYLGLARDPRMLDAMRSYLEHGDAGAPASRLLRGNHPEHVEAEAAFARFKGTEAALFFSSGFQANVGMLTGLICRHDRVLTDRLNHASLIDGLRLTRAERVVFPHLDLDFLDRKLREPHEIGRTFVVVESLFSMDGDIAPLDEIAALSDQHNALLIVDEAHATGVFGDKGSGLVEQFGVGDKVLATTATCGKALGLAGAFVCASQTVIDHLVNHARSFIYSTAPIPVLAHGIRKAIELIAAEPEPRARVIEVSKRIRTRLSSAEIPVSMEDSPVLSVVLSDRHEALEVSDRLRQRNLDVRALRPPTVPVGTSRLRISLHSRHTDAEIDGLADALIEILSRG
jgi:8-amino-7-oxononanoate synthase